MREIKFRGKRVDDGVFVYGSLVMQQDIPFIHVDDIDRGKLNFFQVIYQTVGQYTGLKDKNGVEIYEGDIVTADAIRNYLEQSVISDVIFTTSTDWGAWQVRSDGFDSFHEHGLNLRWGGWKSIEVIGNIHEK